MNKGKRQTSSSPVVHCLQSWGSERWTGTGTVPSSPCPLPTSLFSLSECLPLPSAARQLYKWRRLKVKVLPADIQTGPDKSKHEPLRGISAEVFVKSSDTSHPLFYRGKTTTMMMCFQWRIRENTAELHALLTIKTQASLELLQFVIIAYSSFCAILTSL